MTIGHFLLLAFYLLFTPGLIHHHQKKGTRP